MDGGSGRNIVLCCDGTANEFAVDRTNVVKLYYLLSRDRDEQITYYHPGLGTMEPPGATNTYECTRIRVANDMWIAGFRAASPVGTHHSVLTISTTNTATGDYDCFAGSLDTQMLYAAGVGTDDEPTSTPSAVFVSSVARVIVTAATRATPRPA